MKTYIVEHVRGFADLGPKNIVMDSEKVEAENFKEAIQSIAGELEGWLWDSEYQCASNPGFVNRPWAFCDYWIASEKN